MMPHPFIRIVLGITTLLLGACSQLQPAPSNSDDFTPNMAIQHWQLRGKMGIRYDGNAASPYLNWLQCGDAFDIRLSGPLGQGAAHLYGDQQQATLKTSDQQTFSAPSARELLSRQLGWEIPVSQLQYWIRGIPDPALASTPNAQGFQQLGWQLSYSKQRSYTQPSTAKPYPLPGKVVAIHPRLKLTLILKHWELQPNCSEPRLPD